MARADQTEIALRFIIESPVPGVAHALQDKKNHPVSAQVAKDEDLAFDFSIRVGPGPKFYGEHVRSEGPERRFVYVALGQAAGQTQACWTRRMKVDIHTLPEALIEKAIKGKTLELRLPGRDKDGSPSCATVTPLGPWRAIA